VGGRRGLLFQGGFQFLAQGSALSLQVIRQRREGLPRELLVLLQASG